MADDSSWESLLILLILLKILLTKTLFNSGYDWNGFRTGLGKERRKVSFLVKSCINHKTRNGIVIDICQ